MPYSVELLMLFPRLVGLPSSIKACHMTFLTTLETELVFAVMVYFFF
jgi:hypothetical protein